MHGMKVMVTRGLHVARELVQSKCYPPSHTLGKAEIDMCYGKYSGSLCCVEMMYCLKKRRQEGSSTHRYICICTCWLSSQLGLWQSHIWTFWVCGMCKSSVKLIGSVWHITYIISCYVVVWPGLCILHTLAISNRLTCPGNFACTAHSRGVRYELSLLFIPDDVPYLHKYSKHLQHEKDIHLNCSNTIMYYLHLSTSTCLQLQLSNQHFS